MNFCIVRKAMLNLWSFSLDFNFTIKYIFMHLSITGNKTKQYKKVQTKKLAL